MKEITKEKIYNIVGRICFVLAILFVMGIVMGLTVSMFILGFNIINSGQLSSNPYDVMFFGIAVFSFAGLGITAAISRFVNSCKVTD